MEPTRFNALFGIMWTPITLFWFLYVLFLVKVSDYVVGRIVKEPIIAALFLIMLGATGFEVGEMLNQHTQVCYAKLCAAFSSMGWGDWPQKEGIFLIR